MIFFYIVETINKFIGVFLTALTARCLSQEFFTIFLYLQQVYSYLQEGTFLASCQKNLIEYSKNEGYLLSDEFKIVQWIKLALFFFFGTILIYVSLNSEIVFIYRLASLFCVLFVFDFVLYVKNDYKTLVIFRFLSQIFILIFLLSILFGITHQRHILAGYTLQTVILTFGIYYIVKARFSFNVFSKLSLDFNLIKRVNSVLTNLLNHFFIKTFLLYFLSIEIVFLGFSSIQATLGIFAQGIKLANVILPFALFYINFQVKKIEHTNPQKFILTILCISTILLISSPAYTLILFGKSYLKNVYSYNYLLIVFLAMSILQLKNYKFLKLGKEKKLAKINTITLFFNALVLVIVINFFDYSLADYLKLFVFKIIVYMVLISKIFESENIIKSISENLIGIVWICMLNYFLNLQNYYNYMADFTQSIIVNLNLTQLI